MGSFEDTAPTLTSDRPEAYCGVCDRSYPINLATCPVDGTKLVRFQAKADPMLGRVLDGRYRIDTKLGQGGMGAVYCGRQLSVDREVAIKVVHEAIASDRDAAKRFLREARVASKLNAPGIVAVYDFGQTDDGVLFLVMELIEGRSLAEQLKAKTGLDPDRVVRIALQLCDALVVAHGAGIVHRDLKPANIITTGTPLGEVVKVLDFGIAKTLDAPSITSTQSFLGTPIYMAPEQFEGRADVRSDLYSFGCVLYELLSGGPPFVATDINTLLTKHLTEAPAALPVGVPRRLAHAIERLLEKEPANRFQSADELRHALKGAVPYQPGPIIRTSLMELADPMAATGQARSAAAVQTATDAGALQTGADVSSLAPAPDRRRTVALLGAAVAAAALGAGVFVAMRGSRSTMPAQPAASTPAPPLETRSDPPQADEQAAPAVTVPVDAGIAITPADAAVEDKTSSAASAKPRTPTPSPKTSPKKTPAVSGHPTTTVKPRPDAGVELPFVKTN